MSEENSIIVPVLSENLTLMTFCVTKDFESKFSLRAVDLLEAAEDNGVDLDPNNQFMQASSFLLQSAFEFYLEHHPQDDIDPPIIS